MSLQGRVDVGMGRERGCGVFISSRVYRMTNANICVFPVRVCNLLRETWRAALPEVIWKRNKILQEH